MWVYYLYFIIILICSAVLRKTTTFQLKQNKSVVLFPFLAVLLIWFIIGSRDVSVGIDTKDYVEDFRTVSLSWFSESTEPLYILVTYLTRQFTSNYHIFFLIMSLPFCMGVYKLLTKYLHKADEMFLGVCILFLFGIFYLSMAAMRQTAALGFTILAFMAADKNKWKSFAMWAIIAAGFHNTAILALIMYPLRYLNLRKYGILIVVGLYALSLVIPKDFMMLLQLTLDSDNMKYTQYGTDYESELSLSGFYLQLIPLIIVYIRREKLPFDERTRNLFVNCAYLGAGLQSLVTVVAEFYRLSIYFSVFGIVLIPLALSTFLKPYRTLGKIIFALGCLLYIFVLAPASVVPIYK